MSDYCYRLVEAFLAKSMVAVNALVDRVVCHREVGDCRRVSFFQFVNGRKVCVTFDGGHFYLRGSVEYSNPQLTVEEIQGIIGIRLLQVCANYCLETGARDIANIDCAKLCETLKGSPSGYVLPFLLNTDDVEADRYSINPLRQSLVDSGQSAFPVANIRTGQLRVDKAFVEAYEDFLISKAEADFISEELSRYDNYMDFVDAVKFRQLEELSSILGMNLSLYALRMPLSTLEVEGKGDLLHYIISSVHKSRQSIEQAYNCMGRSISKRTTLLAVPHSKKGYGSKRAAHGKLHFNDDKLVDVNVKYKSTRLYPNDADQKNVSIAQCSDNFTVTGEEFADYNYAETPASPQFFLYALASPEDAALWHGVGVFAASNLLQTYILTHKNCSNGLLLPEVTEKFGLECHVPLQFNLVPDGMWRNPIRQNIDASMGCIKDFNDLINNRGMWIEHLSEYM
ncbi:MAG: hypothetical protein FWF66_01325 [Candidatus Bathyarchaeota archaeon]|nr:hypothetical protein [Candidatus Termiticorpusculum sp.]MCL1970094.1 hypothetical protein [Candidatus Termiticorpusculum sp.]